MRRLFSTFADRLPNHGLLLLRVIVGSALIARSLERVNDTSLRTIAPHAVSAGVGLFLLIGLWTSVAGAILAISELFIAFSHHHDLWLSVLLASIGVALALVGAGSWSLDARRSGWKRIEIRPPDN